MSYIGDILFKVNMFYMLACDRDACHEAYTNALGWDFKLDSFYDYSPCVCKSNISEEAIFTIVRCSVFKIDSPASITSRPTLTKRDIPQAGGTNPLTQISKRIP